MADEIAQVMQLEIEEVKIMMKATATMASWLARALKALVDYTVKPGIKAAYEAHLHKAGEVDYKQLFKSSNGNVQVFKVPEDKIDEVKRLLIKNGIQFASTVDFDATDGLTPIAIDGQHAPIVASIIESVMKQKLEEDISTCSGYEEKLAEINEKINSYDEKNVPEDLIMLKEQYEQAVEESKVTIGKDEELAGQTKGTSIVEYLKEAKGTDFEKDPDKAITELMEGVEIGKEYTLKDVLQPVRSESLLPGTKMSAYVPEMGETIVREFKLDEETNLVYSEYKIIDSKGEIKTYSDKEVTTEKWNQEILPNVYDAAGTLEETKCRVFTSEDAANIFKEKHNAVTPASEENVKKNRNGENEGFSSPEAANEIKIAVSEKKKGDALVPKNKEYTITVPADIVTKRFGKINIQMDEYQSYQISGIKAGDIKDGMISFSINENTNVKYKKTNSASSRDIITSSSPENVQKAAKEAFGTLSNIVANKNVHREKR